MRLAGQEKAGYYPTPPELIAPIRSWLSYETAAESDNSKPTLDYRVLDPCAGRGDALYDLIEPFNRQAVPHAIELDEGRGTRLLVRGMGHSAARTLVGDAFDTSIAQESMALLFLNPPYDYAYEETGVRRQRLELHFLKQFTPTLFAPGGVLVYVVPHSLLGNPATTRYLATHYDTFMVARFDDANDVYKQVVVYARRKGTPAYDGAASNRLLALGDLRWRNLPAITETDVPRDEDGHTPYRLIAADCSEPILFRRTQLEPAEVAERAEPVRLEHLAAAGQRIGRIDVRTATPPRAGHVAMLIAGGVTNATLLQVDDPEYVTDTSSDSPSGDEEDPAYVTFADFDDADDGRDAHRLQGAQNGVEGDVDGQCDRTNLNIVTPIPQVDAIIKGRSYKAIEVSYEDEDVSTDEEHKVAGRTIRRETIRSDITVLDAKGNVAVVKPSEMAAFLNRHMPTLVDELNVRMRPYYDFSGMNGFERAIRGLNPRRRIPNTDRRGLMTAQQHVVAAAATTLEHEDAAIVVGEMGTGKTLMGAGVAAALHAKGRFQRGVIICPPHLVDKWAEEVVLTWPDCRVMSLKTPSDVEKLFHHPGPILGILKSTTMSLGPGWEHAFDYAGPARLKTRGQRGQYVFSRKPKPWILAGRDGEFVGKPVVTPRHGQIAGRTGKAETPSEMPNSNGIRHSVAEDVQKEQNGHNVQGIQSQANPSRPHPTIQPDAVDLYRNYRNRRGIRCPVCGHKQTVDVDDFRNKRLFCENGACNSPLYQFTSDIRRWPLARVIKRAAKRYGKLDLVIADEVHQHKAADSDRGYAFGHMAGAAKKTLALTGTLFGGKASTLFWLLYRMMPRFRRAFTNTGAVGTRRIQDARFIDRYGLMEEIETVVSKDGKTSGNAKATTYTRELPGLVPELINQLLPYCVFINLGDMGYALPPYRESKVAVALTPAMRQEYDRVVGLLYEAVSQALAKKDKGLLGAYLSILMTWPEIPSRVRSACDRDGVHIVTTEPFPEETLTPKEEAIISHIKRSLAEHRKVMLYLEMTAKTDITPRWRKLLQKEGITSAVCIAPPDKRIEWFERERDKGTQVILVHPRRVELGLDLYDWPEVIWMHEHTYSSYLILQASRRAWRIGQTQPVNVTFYYYRDTIQETAMAATQQKALANLRLAGGIIDDDNLAGAGGMDNIEQLLGRILVQQHRVEMRLSHARLFLADVANGKRAGPTAAAFQELLTLPTDELTQELENVIASLEDELAAMNPARTLDSLFAKKTAVIDGIRTGHTNSYLSGNESDKYSEFDDEEADSDDEPHEEAGIEAYGEADIEAYGEAGIEAYGEAGTNTEVILSADDVAAGDDSSIDIDIDDDIFDIDNDDAIDLILGQTDPEPLDGDVDDPVLDQTDPEPLDDDEEPDELPGKPNPFREYVDSGMALPEKNSLTRPPSANGHGRPAGAVVPNIDGPTPDVNDMETFAPANQPVLVEEIPNVFAGDDERHFLITGRNALAVWSLPAEEKQAGVLGRLGNDYWLELGQTTVANFLQARMDGMDWAYEIISRDPVELEAELFEHESAVRDGIRARQSEPGYKIPGRDERLRAVHDRIIGEVIARHREMYQAQAAKAAEGPPKHDLPPVVLYQIPVSGPDEGQGAYDSLYLTAGDDTVPPDGVLFDKEIQIVTYAVTGEIHWVTIHPAGRESLGRSLQARGREVIFVDRTAEELEAMLFNAEDAVRRHILTQFQLDTSYKLPTRDEREWMAVEVMVLNQIDEHRSSYPAAFALTGGGRNDNNDDSVDQADDGEDAQASSHDGNSPGGGESSTEGSPPAAESAAEPQPDSPGQGEPAEPPAKPAGDQPESPEGTADVKVYKTFPEHAAMLTQRATVFFKLHPTMGEGAPLRNAYTMTEDAGQGMPRGRYLPVFLDGELLLYRLGPQKPAEVKPEEMDDVHPKYLGFVGAKVALKESVYPTLYVLPDYWRVEVE